jgi:hypothetical protein
MAIGGVVATRVDVSVIPAMPMVPVVAVVPVAIARSRRIGRSADA